MLVFTMNYSCHVKMDDPERPDKLLHFVTFHMSTQNWELVFSSYSKICSIIILEVFLDCLISLLVTRSLLDCLCCLRSNRQLSRLS